MVHIFALLSTLALLTASTKVSINDLSAPVRQIYTHVIDKLQSDETLSPTPKDLILTSGHFKHQFADYGTTDSFGKNVFVERIANAQSEVLMTTFIWDSNAPEGTTPRELVRALRLLNENAEKRQKKVKFYMMYDEFGTAFFQKRYGSLVEQGLVQIFKPTRQLKHPEKRNLPKLADLLWIDFRVKTFHKGMVGTLHSKMILIDGHTTIMGSKNMDADTSMEYMFVMSGAVTNSLRADFEGIWGEKVITEDNAAVHHKRQVDVPVVVVSRRQSNSLGGINAPQDQAWLKALQVAEKEVYIQTPNFCERTMSDAVIEAVKRVKVTIVTSFRQQDGNQAVGFSNEGSNGGTMNDMYAALAYDPMVAARLRWCWYIGKNAGPSPKPTATNWSHVKAMIVDDKFAIVGSGNQDQQSWFNSRENNLLIDDAGVAKSIKQTLMAPQQFGTMNCYTGAPGEVRLI